MRHRILHLGSACSFGSPVSLSLPGILTWPSSQQRCLSVSPVANEFNLMSICKIIRWVICYLWSQTGYRFNSFVNDT